MKRLNELFTVSYGNKFDLNKMERLPRSAGGVSFVGRSSRRQGVSATVAKLKAIDPYPAGLITVALGGAILSTFVQKHPFYTAQNVAVLNPLEPMTFQELVYACLCIRNNRFRYSAFGREANRTLRELLVPGRDEFPEWLNDPRSNPADIAARLASEFEQVQVEADGKTGERGWETVMSLFAIQYGNNYELNGLSPDPAGINFVSRRMGNNGVSARVKPTDEAPFPAGLLTVALSGNGVLETCVQPAPFYTAHHVAVLRPLVEMGLLEKLYYALAIKINRFRYGFGRQANRSLPMLRLPPQPEWLQAVSVSDVRAALSQEVGRTFAGTTN